MSILAEPPLPDLDASELAFDYAQALNSFVNIRPKRRTPDGEIVNGELEDLPHELPRKVWEIAKLETKPPTIDMFIKDVAKRLDETDVNRVRKYILKCLGIPVAAVDD